MSITPVTPGVTGDIGDFWSGVTGAMGDFECSSGFYHKGEWQMSGVMGDFESSSGHLLFGC